RFRTAQPDSRPITAGGWRCALHAGSFARFGRFALDQPFRSPVVLGRHSWAGFPRSPVRSPVAVEAVRSVVRFDFLKSGGLSAGPVCTGVEITIAGGNRYVNAAGNINFRRNEKARTGRASA